MVPAIDNVRRESLYPIGEGVSETISEDEGYERPVERLMERMPLAGHNNRERHGRQVTDADSEKNDESPKQRRRKAAATEVTLQHSQTAKQPHRTDHFVQKYELFGQQSNLRKAYMTAEKIGWQYKDGEKHQRSDWELDDKEVKSLMRLCNEATSRLTDLVELSDDYELLSDPPEELELIDNAIRDLGRKAEYFVDENKASNIYFHLFASLLNLVRHAIDCYGEMDKDEEGLTPQRSITIHHLGLIANILKLIIFLHEAVERKYCAPEKGLCVKQPVKSVIMLLRPVQERFSREIHRHQEYEQQRQEDDARAEADALREERLEREEALEKQRNELRNKWLHLHDERREVGERILPPKKQAHLRVPELEPDTDGNGEAFERLEVFAPRYGPSVASTEKARQVAWTSVELDALRNGLEEFAGERVFVKMFRRYCVWGGPLNRFNVTEIVTIAADMRQWEEDQQRRNGRVEGWVLVDKPYMWTKPRLIESGQENYGVDA